MFAANPGSGNAHVGRWKDAGLELQQMLNGIFKRIQDEPAGRLQEDQLGPVEIIFTQLQCWMVLSRSLQASKNTKMVCCPRGFSRCS